MAVTDDLITFRTASPPRSAVEMLRLSLLDWMACAIAGAREAEFAAFTRAAEGAGNASIVGGAQSNAPQAALVNGTLSHALDYDDTHLGHIGHPSVAVLPAVIAVAETEGVPFADLLDAATIGIEASVHVGLWLGRTHYQVGFHQTATAGAFGATLGCARLLQLDEHQTRMALGLCASMASGIKAQFGTMAKPLNAGLAARTGVEAALWARAGMTASDDGLAGPLGFGATHHGEANPISLGAQPWQIESISHKFHACCHGLHATLEALDGQRWAAHDIDSISIRTHPRWMSVCNIAQPRTALEAKFSYAQVTAMTLLGHDTSAIDSFSNEIVDNPEVSLLRGRVVVNEDEHLNETTAEIDMTLANGQVQRFSHDLMTPITVAERAARLRRKSAALLGETRGAEVWSAVQGSSLQDLSHQLLRS